MTKYFERVFHYKFQKFGEKAAGFIYGECKHYNINILNHKSRQKTTDYPFKNLKLFVISKNILVFAMVFVYLCKCYVIWILFYIVKIILLQLPIFDTSMRAGFIRGIVKKGKQICVNANLFSTVLNLIHFRADYSSLFLKVRVFFFNDILCVRDSEFV